MKFEFGCTEGTNKEAIINPLQPCMLIAPSKTHTYELPAMGRVTRITGECKIGWPTKHPWILRANLELSQDGYRWVAIKTVSGTGETPIPFDVTTAIKAKYFRIRGLLRINFIYWSKGTIEYEEYMPPQQGEAEIKDISCSEQVSMGVPFNIRCTVLNKGVYASVYAKLLSGGKVISETRKKIGSGCELQIKFPVTITTLGLQQFEIIAGHVV